MDGSLERKRRQLDLNRRLGHLLASLRKEQHLKQEDIAKRMGFGRPLVSKIENGQHNLDATEICDYASALRVDPEELFHQLHVIVIEYDGTHPTGRRE